MPNNETPEEFREFVDEIMDLGWRDQEFPNEGDDQMAYTKVAARDAAIHTESAELLKMCGEALVLGREKVQKWVNEIYDAGGVEYIGLGSTLDKIDTALAALREAGVICI